MKGAEKDWPDLLPFLKSRLTEIEEQLVPLVKRAYAPSSRSCGGETTRMAVAGSSKLRNGGRLSLTTVAAFLSPSPIKDGLQQNEEVSDGRLVQVSQ